MRGWYLVAYARRAGLPVVITEGIRSAGRQAELYAQGRSRPGPIVTNTLRSKHVTGHAFDIDLYQVAPDRVAVPVWEWCGRLGEALGLVWGGRWRMRDYRHFEL